jgi:hypothetical protein
MAGIYGDDSPAPRPGNWTDGQHRRRCDPVDRDLVILDLSVGKPRPLGQRRAHSGTLDKGKCSPRSRRYCSSRSRSLAHRPASGR